MTPKLIVGLAALLLAVPLAMAATYSYERQSVGPTTAKSSVLGEFGVASCDDGAIAAQLAFLDCGTGGIGAIVDVSNIATSTNYVSGTCKVKQTSSNVVGIGPFSYSCGTDRDNDGFVTNTDASSTAVGDKNDFSVHPDGYDDDFTDAVDVGPGAQGSAPVCFRADVDSGPVVGGYPTSAVWDDFIVFIAVNVDSTAVTEGTFDVDIVVSDAANGGCVPSAHTIASWVDFAAGYAQAQVDLENGTVTPPPGWSCTTSDRPVEEAGVGAPGTYFEVECAPSSFAASSVAAAPCSVTAGIAGQTGGVGHSSAFAICGANAQAVCHAYYLPVVGAQDCSVTASGGSGPGRCAWVTTVNVNYNRGGFCNFPII